MIDHVTVDSFESSRIATAHLIEQGHRRLAFVTPSGPHHEPATRRSRAFSRPRAQRGLEASAHVVESLPGRRVRRLDDGELGRTQAQPARADCPQRPTGVVGVNDLLAYGLMAGFRDAGLAVPRRRVGGRHRQRVPLHPDVPRDDLGARAGAEMAQVMVERVMSRFGRRRAARRRVPVRAHAGGARLDGAAARLSRLFASSCTCP